MNIQVCTDLLFDKRHELACVFVVGDCGCEAHP